MAIGLNYSPIQIGNGSQLLQNYMYCLDESLWSLDGVLPVGVVPSIREEVTNGSLLKFLQDEDSNERFDDPLLRKLLLEAYPYEVTNKFMGGNEPVDKSRDKRIIDLFDTFFNTDFDLVVNNYAKRSPGLIAGLMKRSSTIHQETYEKRDAAVDAYFSWVDTLLKTQGFEKEAAALQEFHEKNMIIRYREGISGVTFSDDEKIIIEVGNNTYVTLFHEITHLVSKFFRFTYYDNHEVCFDNYTKTNEGLANYVAYHLFEGIMSADKESIEHISSQELFYSPYIGVYALLRERGSNDKEYNFSLVKAFMESYEGELLTEEKARFYFERFYKFFNYNQHEFFYPKEILYYLGYNQIREMINESGNGRQLLTQLLLGKVCL